MKVENIYIEDGLGELLGGMPTGIGGKVGAVDPEVWEDMPVVVVVVWVSVVVVVVADMELLDI